MTTNMTRAQQYDLRSLVDHILSNATERNEATRKAFYAVADVAYALALAVGDSSAEAHEFVNVLYKKYDEAFPIA